MIEVNGKTMVAQARDVHALLEELGHVADRGIAVAVNGEVVPRSAWPGHVLRAGDRVEIVGAVQGG